MRIRVATLNVWALPTPFSEHVSERMAAIGAELPGLAADVVALQEVWTSGARDALVAAGRRAGLCHRWHNVASIGGSGLLVLSKLPIAAAHFERFSLRGVPEEIGGDFYAGKGFVQLLVETPAGPVAVFNTHLHARYPRRVEHEYRSVRAGQIVQLAVSMRRLSAPVIAAGDFNFRERDAGHALLTGLAGVGDVAAQTGRRQPTVRRQNAYRHGRGKPDKRIDYVFARSGTSRRIEARSIQRVFDSPLEIDGARASYSDHAGLLAEFEVTSGSGGGIGAPDQDAIALARRLLARGRDDARKRQRDQRTWAGAGVAGALAAGTGMRGLSTTRRRVLRVGALLALTPAFGLSVLSEWFVPDELRAFDALAAELARVERPADDAIA